MDVSSFKFVDIKTRTISRSINSLFPDWQPGNERVVVLSPHDDDAPLGAGHVMLAAQAFGGEVHVVVFCNGCAGYSTPEEKGTIVETRHRETVEAFAAMGVPETNIHRLDYDDFSVLPRVGWRLPTGEDGTFGRLVPLLRDLKATRLVIPNGYREHIDHEAAFKAGSYDAPQVGDPIIAEWGLADPVKTVLQYAVWGDFSPEEALVDGRDLALRANSLVLCEQSAAAAIDAAILAWKSQARIIDGLLKARQSRRCGSYAAEAYMRFNPRPALDYAPYVEWLRNEFGEI